MALAGRRSNCGLRLADNRGTALLAVLSKKRILWNKPCNTHRVMVRAVAYGVGIDLGTSTSAVAVIKDGRPVLVEDSHGPAIIPSIVAYNQIGPGAAIGFAAQRQALMMDPASVFYSVKRLMGRKYSEVPAAVCDSLAYRVVEGRDGWALLNCPATQQDLQPEEVSSLILRHLLERAAAFLGLPAIHAAVVTVPAHFGSAQKAATVRAAKMAGLRHVSLLQEPVAAAIANGFGGATSRNNAAAVSDTLLVVDLGGGTFDVSVLDSFEGILEVLATAGDIHLGGDDFTRSLQTWLAGQMPPLVQEQLQSSETAPALRLALWHAAESAKLALTWQETTGVCLEPLLPPTARTALQQHYRQLQQQQQQSRGAPSTSGAPAADDAVPQRGEGGGAPLPGALPVRALAGGGRATVSAVGDSPPPLAVSRTLFNELTNHLMARMWLPLRDVAEVSRLEYSGSVPQLYCEGNADAPGCKLEAPSDQHHALAAAPAAARGNATTAAESLAGASNPPQQSSSGELASVPFLNAVRAAMSDTSHSNGTSSSSSAGSDGGGHGAVEGDDLCTDVLPVNSTTTGTARSGGNQASALSPSISLPPTSPYPGVASVDNEAPGDPATAKYIPPPRRLTGIVLVGAGTRMLALRQYIQQLTGITPSTSVDPEAAVALGAALQAGVLAGVPLVGQHGGSVELMDGAYVATAHGRASGFS